jgi:hypothetical protein
LLNGDICSTTARYVGVSSAASSALAMQSQRTASFLMRSEAANQTKKNKNDQGGRQLALLLRGRGKVAHAANSDSDVIPDYTFVKKKMQIIISK